MPREPDVTPVRRVLMQSIMWIVLGATVAAAAAMTHYKRWALNPSLGEPVQFKGVSVCLPAGWTVPKDVDENSLIRRNPQFDDVLALTVRQLSLSEVLGMSRPNPPEDRNFVQNIDVGGTSVKLVRHQGVNRSGKPVIVLEASRSLPKARLLSITMIVPGVRGGPELAPAIDLVKRVGASIEIDANY